jgi:hypothetical protein
MDLLLQQPAASPGSRHENPCYGVCFSSLTCAEIGGSLHDGIARPFESLLKPTNKNYVFVWKSVDANGKVTLHRAKGFEHMFVSFLREHNLLVDPKTEQNRKLYSLRHTYATLALTHDKVPIHTLAKQMGTSVLMIERHYSDLEPVKAIDQLRGEKTRRLIDAGTVVDGAYVSNKKLKGFKKLS